MPHVYYNFMLTSELSGACSSLIENYSEDDRETFFWVKSIWYYCANF